ncbi:MAG: hypothetical protein HYX73_07600 [Acidobacteria bacterium]|nr:hypothetical protein [Acidobacteriota bacterium]
MRALMSLLGLVIVLAIGQFIYRSYFTGPSGGAATMGTNNPRAIADVTGVRNDLLAMAQAERAYMALNGRYASLADLRTSGDLLIDPARDRQGYYYSAQVSDRSFLITATYTGPATGMPTLSIDESMQVTQH